MRIIYEFMNASAAASFVRLTFIVLFAAMSLMHGPVMAYSAGHHASGHHAGTSHDPHAAGHHDHGNSSRPNDPASCNGFACFIAVEPVILSARPLHAIMIGILRFAPAGELHAASVRPTLPPPRFPS